MVAAGLFVLSPELSHSVSFTGIFLSLSLIPNEISVVSWGCCDNSFPLPSLGFWVSYSLSSLAPIMSILDVALSRVFPREFCSFASHALLLSVLILLCICLFSLCLSRYPLPSGQVHEFGSS